MKELKDYQKFIFDIETDSIDAKEIRCLSYCDTKTGLICSTTYIDQMKDFFSQEEVFLVGHNIQGFDIPVAERLLGIKVNCRLIDTLALSWILRPEREKHGLESYCEETGVDKPKIDDFANQDIKDIIFRCESDVKNNWIIWKKFASYLNNLYEGNHSQIYRYLAYIEEKMDTINEHSKLGVNFDEKLCRESLEELEKLKLEKFDILKNAMPKRPIKGTKNPPKVMFKANGEPSENRLKWLKFLEEQGLPPFYSSPVEYIMDYEEPNPNSSDQIKKWLYSLGWEPQHFKYVKQEGKREMRKIPQIKAKDETDGSICESILKLVEKEPSLEALDSLSILSHRIGLFQGFLRDQKDGRLHQSLQGITNTLRIKHKYIVNLPLPFKKYAENVRKCLIADEGMILLGADLANIESRLRDHFIYGFDKEYVEEMQIEGFDSHLDIAVLAGFLTTEQAENHKKGLENHKEARQKAKTVNFAAQYGVGAPTLSRNSGMTIKECEKLLEVYWKRNWAVKKVAENCIVKNIGAQKWLYNPISGFWYNLRAEKDRFSTLVQGSAVYCFDRWLFYIRRQNIPLYMQMHDETLTNICEEYKERVSKKFQTAIDMVNGELKLNVKLGCGLSYGTNYADAH